MPITRDVPGWEKRTFQVDQYHPQSCWNIKTLRTLIAAAEAVASGSVAPTHQSDPGWSQDDRKARLAGKLPIVCHSKHRKAGRGFAYARSTFRPVQGKGWFGRTVTRYEMVIVTWED